MKYLRKGFTLIELIIGITVFGIIAAGLLAVLDPVEQIRRSSDIGAKNIANEILRAANRYYTTYQKWPRGNVTVSGPSASPGISTDLVNSGQLKKDYRTITLRGLTYNFYFATGEVNASGSPITGPYVCFGIVRSKFLLDEGAVNNRRYPGLLTYLPVDCQRNGDNTCVGDTGTDGIPTTTQNWYCIRGN